MDKTICTPCTPEDALQSHGTLDTTSSHTQPHTEEGVEHTDDVPKVHKRKRFTKAETREHLDLITKAVEANKSLTTLRRELGIPETKFLNYIAELALTEKISLAGYSDSVIPASDLQKIALQRLGITDTKNTLLKLEISDTGLLVSIVPSEHNI